MGSGRDGCGDLGEVQVHRLGVAGRHDQGCTLALLRADCTEDVGGSGPLVPRCAWTGAALGPAAGDLVLLADASLVGEPDFYRVAVERLGALSSSMTVPSRPPSAAGRGIPGCSPTSGFQGHRLALATRGLRHQSPLVGNISRSVPPLVSRFGENICLSSTVSGLDCPCGHYWDTAADRH